MQDANVLTYLVRVLGVDEGVAAFGKISAAGTAAMNQMNKLATASSVGSKAQYQLSESVDKAANSTNRASKAQRNYFAHIARTTVQSAFVNKAFLGLVDAAGQAVKQVDLMQNFPASMAALGLSAEDARVSLSTLRDYVGQIGGDLTNATASVARFAEVTKNVKAATAEFVGVNNALIAGGAGAEVQANALEQLIQAYSRGKPQLIEWRSMMVAMPAQLNQVAKAMNFSNAQFLGEALTSGKVSMQDFITELTKLSTGTGPIAQQALARMQGIQFAANVMKNALTNGLAAIYQAVGRNNIIAFFNFLTQVIIVLSQWVVALINNLISLFNWISGIFGGPQIARFSGEAAGAADAIGTGAENASDMADGLGDAADNAAKINKSLASFDKMNVLSDKTSGGGGGSGGGSGGGGGGLDPAAAGALNGIFDSIGKKMQEISGWAKFLAGVLSSILALKFGKMLLKDFNDTLRTIQETTRQVKSLGKAIKNISQKSGDVLSKVGKSVGSGVGKVASSLAYVISGFIGGIVSAIGTVIAPAIGSAVSAVAAAIAGALAAGAAALGVTVGVFVLIIVAIVAAVIAAVVLIWKYWDQIWGFMKATFDVVWGGIVSAWNTFYDIFAPPIKWLLQFFNATFTLIVAIVAVALELMVKLVAGTILLIYNILSAVAGWVRNNVITPVTTLFTVMWELVVLGAKIAWSFILNNILLPVASWVNGNVIQPVLTLFRGLWDIITSITNLFFGNVKNILGPLASWIKTNVIDRIASYFSSLWDGIRNGLSNMISALGSIFGNLGNIAKAPINGLIDVFNGLFRRLNSIKVPDWVPGYGGKSVNFPQIPKLAKGGVIDQPTFAMLGEAGKEAVVPLENNTEWLDMLASKINGGSGSPMQLVVQIGEDRIASKMIDLINEKTTMSGRNVIYV